ncbi:hypothetical protein I352_05580 [Cryptococcus deuterogattii MMRL2647]|nr:hypothetical protein I352_05580 [Cryptococcus deuterogattii MMRL2647]
MGRKAAVTYPLRAISWLWNIPPIIQLARPRNIEGRPIVLIGTVWTCGWVTFFSPLITSHPSTSTALNVHINRDIRLSTLHTQPSSHLTTSIVIRDIRWPQKDTQNCLDRGYTGSLKNDTFRTLATDTQFKGKVKEDMLIRLLEAFVWRITCTHTFPMETEDESQPFKYVQGMNVLSAPFLFTMPSQLEAFQCFSTFIENGCPLYVQPSLKGVHKGLTVFGGR